MMKDIKFDNYDTQFLVRVAGINNDRSKVLVHKKKGDNFWNLIGGKPFIGEITEEALVREYLEETSLEVKVGNLMCTLENIFCVGEVLHHEIVFIYNVRFSNNIDVSIDIVSKEEDIILKWFSEEEIPNEDFLPTKVKDLLFLEEKNIKHITNVEL